MIEEELEFTNKPSDDAFIQINYFMTGKLGLKGNDLILYGLINGFSQDGCSFCYSSMKYIEELTGMSHSSVSRALDSLVQQNLIVTEQVQSYTKQTSNGKIIQVKAKGAQFFSLRYTVKSRPAIQKIIDELKYYSEKIKSISNESLSAEIISLIRQIKENETKNKSKGYSLEYGSQNKESLTLETIEDISKVLLKIHYNSFNENLISRLLEVLKNTFCENNENYESQNETGKNKDVAQNHQCQNETRSSVKMNLEDDVYQCQNETRSSVKMRHNNNINNKFNLKTTSTTMPAGTIQNKTSDFESVAVVDGFTNSLIKVFGYNPCYPAETETTLTALFRKYNVSLEYLDRYLNQMYNLLEQSCKNKDRFSSYFFKSFLIESYVSKFAYDLNQEKKNLEEKEKSMVTCPVCGKRHSKKDFRCPECELPSDYIADESEINKAKAVYNLKKTDRLKYQEYENEITMLYKNYPFSRLLADKTLVIEKEKKIKEIEFKYLGITA